MSEKSKREKKKLEPNDVTGAQEAGGTVSVLALKSIPCPECNAEHVFIELAGGGARPLLGHRTYTRAPSEGLSEATMEASRALVCHCGAVFKVPAPA
jgi:hypothetical protein